MIVMTGLRLNIFLEGELLNALPVTSSHDPRECCVTNNLISFVRILSLEKHICPMTFKRSRDGKLN